jgi:hypothetical protein
MLTIKNITKKKRVHCFDKKLSIEPCCNDDLGIDPFFVLCSRARNREDPLAGCLAADRAMTHQINANP